MNLAHGVKHMTSVELVETINTVREAEGRKPLRHGHFLAKIEKHPAIDSAKFSAQYKDSTGRYLKCYNLPKRECELMVMSESMAVQAKVYDKLNAVQSQATSLSILPPEQQALVALMLQSAEIKATQEKQATEIAQLQETLAVVEARTQPENRHFTVMGYCNLHGKTVDLNAASQLGRKCAEMSRRNGVMIGDVSDPRFGKVHTYHDTVLAAVIFNPENDRLV